ncbi:MAG: virulence RhuM family protein [Bacteroidales bacterium]|nr:virulence RhuM family protein [Bacteroidales bacterium]
MGVDGDQSYDTIYYNLDVIISVGYRVKSRQGTHFRQWANSVLKDYLLRVLGCKINTIFVEDF